MAFNWRPASVFWITLTGRDAIESERMFSARQTAERPKTEGTSTMAPVLDLVAPIELMIESREAPIC